jgi:hypothetical protein
MDCDDRNIDVHPGQMAFFDRPYTTSGGTTSYDYDCDGSPEREYPMAASCPTRPDADCAMTSMGFVDPVPRCGETGYWVSCGPDMTGMDGCALMAPVTMIQGCH